MNNSGIVRVAPAFAIRAKGLVSKPPGFFVRRFTRSNGHCFLLHTVANDPNPFTVNLHPSPSKDGFVRFLGWMKKNYDVVSSSELCAATTGQLAIVGEFAHLSYDDGYREMYDTVFPILRSLGIPATFFITKDCIDNTWLMDYNKVSFLIQHLRHLDPQNVNSFNVLQQQCGSSDHILEDVPKSTDPYSPRGKSIVERLSEESGIDWQDVLSRFQPHCTREQLLEIRRAGFDIGSHGLDHTKFSLLGEDSIRIQVTRSLGRLGPLVGPVKLFAFPHSDVGVPKDLRDRLIRTGLVDLLFTTRGFRPPEPGCFHRIDLDQPSRFPSAWAWQHAVADRSVEAVAHDLGTTLKRSKNSSNTAVMTARARMCSRSRDFAAIPCPLARSKGSFNPRPDGYSTTNYP
jgi:peptidoglycan/xylan/chitin deacetylase (PgdA/CDA1 family)